MKVYLAACYARRKEMQEYAADLMMYGFEVTSRWIDNDDGLEGNPKASTELLRHYAVQDLADIEISDIVISFTEDKRTVGPEISRGGRHVEFGYALAKAKRLIVVGCRENIFHSIYAVEFMLDWESCLEKLAYEAEGLNVGR